MTPDPPAAWSPEAPGPPRAAIPSLARRITLGSLRLIPLIVLYVVLPLVGIGALSSYGIASPVPTATVAAFGLGLAALSTARYIAKPTRAYGPLRVAAGLAAVLYLVYFAGFAQFGVSIQNVGVEIVFGRLLLLLAVVPLISLVAGVVTTVEDARHPGERLPYDFPAV